MRDGNAGRSQKKKTSTRTGKVQHVVGPEKAKVSGRSRDTKVPGGSRKTKVSGKPSDADSTRGSAIRKIISRLERAYPESKIALRFKNPLELLVATILAAQCTDERVNQVTSDLFVKYKKADDYANASLDELMEAVRPTGFFRNKSRSIQAACRLIVQRHRGDVPSTMDELIELPGVARKTANVVLGNAYGVASGIAVDTHMIRVARRLGLTREKDPVKIEKDLCEIVPKKQWIHFPHLVADHGRAVCKARSPLCLDCVLRELCPSRDIYTKNPRTAAPTPKAGAKTGPGGRRRTWRRTSQG